MTLASVQDIQDYLEVEFDSESTPKLSVVERWLDSASAEVENTIKQNLEVVSKTDVIIDITSENTGASQTNWDGVRFTRIPPYRDLIFIPDKNVISLEKVEVNTKGPQEEPEWKELVIGLGKDVRLFNDTIQLLNPSIRPLTGNYKLRISYTTGYSDLLPIAQDIVVYMVSLNIIDQRLINESGAGTGGPIRIGDISVDSNRSFDLNLRERVESLLEKRLEKLGTFNVYII